MRITLIGLNHHTAPIAVRESLAFTPLQGVAALEHWMEKFSPIEAVLLSTCNRTEFYIADESTDTKFPTDRELLEFLCEEKKLTSRQKETIFEHGVVLEDENAVRHLFCVASSLESMVLGEPQILSQVKNAYLTANEIGSTGPLTHRMFQAALRIAKLVASQTELFQKRISIPSVAVVDFAMQIFERLEDKRTLLFGAGEMGEETLQYLKEFGAKTLTIANRSREKAEELAKKWSAQVVDWERRFEELKTADLLISTTGATEPILTFEDFWEIQSFRSGRALFALDLAIPRDIDPKIGTLPNVYLYALDDLKAACDRNRLSRDKEIPKARRIIEHETGRFMKDLKIRKTGAVIKQLREDWNAIKETELQRLFNKLSDLDEKEKEEIRYSFDRLVSKLLHPPMQSLRDEEQPDSGLIRALVRLFRLGITDY